jgi:hypothetical protein
MDTDDVSWLQALLERRPDPGPIVGRWALGIGDMVAGISPVDDDVMEDADERAEQIKSMLAKRKP